MWSEDFGHGKLLRDKRHTLAYLGLKGWEVTYSVLFLVQKLFFKIWQFVATIDVRYLCCTSLKFKAPEMSLLKVLALADFNTPLANEINYTCSLNSSNNSQGLTIKNTLSVKCKNLWIYSPTQTISKSFQIYFFKCFALTVLSFPFPLPQFKQLPATPIPNFFPF